MKAIDTKAWAEFKVGDLFDMVPGKRVRKHDQEPGDILFVMASSANQGIVSSIANPITTVKNGITVDILGNCYYHPERVGYGDDNASLKLKKQYIKYETENVYLFLSTILHNIAKHASFTNKLRGTWYIEQTIKLPVKDASAASVQEGPLDFAYAKSWRTPAEPDWDYMEAFMEQINQQAQARLNEYKEGKLEYTTSDKIGYTPVDTKSWAEFKVGDLFEIENGKYVDPKTLSSDDNGSPYLTASIFNNGQNTDKYTGEGFKTKPNIISWGKQSPLFSYHPEACYTGQGIYWFEFDKGQNVAQFICTVLQNVGKNYNYQNCLTGAKLKQETIKLPIDTTGQPDWNYMESFMKKINQQAQAKLEKLEKGSI